MAAALPRQHRGCRWGEMVTRKEEEWEVAEQEREREFLMELSFFSADLMYLFKKKKDVSFMNYQ